MEKTCESKKRFGKAGWLTEQRKPRTLRPIRTEADGMAWKKQARAYVWR